MNKANPWPMLLVLLSTLSLGLWGCSQQNGAFSAKVRELEARHAKLEDDYRAVSASHEQGRKKLHQAEAGITEAQTRNEELAKQAEDLRQERDELRKVLLARTTERDTVQTQMSQFSRDLQALASRVDAAANLNTNPPLTIAIPTSRKSE